jgi:hypothetical protein
MINCYRIQVIQPYSFTMTQVGLFEYLLSFRGPSANRRSESFAGRPRTSASFVRRPPSPTSTPESSTPTRCPFHKHFTRVTYGCSKVVQTLIKLHGSKAVFKKVGVYLNANKARGGGSHNFFYSYTVIAQYETKKP